MVIARNKWMLASWTLGIAQAGCCLCPKVYYVYCLSTLSPFKMLVKCGKKLIKWLAILSWETHSNRPFHGQIEYVLFAYNCGGLGFRRSGEVNLIIHPLLLLTEHLNKGQSPKKGAPAALWRVLCVHPCPPICGETVFLLLCQGLPLPYSPMNPKNLILLLNRSYY